MVYGAEWNADADCTRIGSVVIRRELLTRPKNLRSPYACVTNESQQVSRRDFLEIVVAGAPAMAGNGGSGDGRRLHSSSLMRLQRRWLDVQRSGVLTSSGVPNGVGLETGYPVGLEGVKS